MKAMLRAQARWLVDQEGVRASAGVLVVSSLPSRRTRVTIEVFQFALARLVRASLVALMPLLLASCSQVEDPTLKRPLSSELIGKALADWALRQEGPRAQVVFARSESAISVTDTVSAIHQLAFDEINQWEMDPSRPGGLLWDVIHGSQGTAGLCGEIVSSANRAVIENAPDREFPVQMSILAVHLGDDCREAIVECVRQVGQSDGASGLLIYVSFLDSGGVRASSARTWFS